VLGTAGVGKSRLADEFLSGLEATIVHGRCLSYGEGITYWPVVEVLKQLDALPSDPAAATALRSLFGESDEGTSADEIAWAFRKLLEEQAPLVCVFDDIQWGEETFLDLVEHIADLSRDAPILLLCLARAELLDKRSGWGGGKLNATTVLLEPLSADETDALLDALGGDAGDLRDPIREAAEGNPLFVEEMLALVRESKGGEIVIPPTIQALLAARLDQLQPPERRVLECGSVEGRVFHRGAVRALAPEEPQLQEKLVSLVRRELVRPDRAQISGEEAFRFRHLLIRDAAYDALPKSARAEMHEGFARWLEERGSDLVELDEVLGHHLEQSVRFKRELGEDDPALADRAAERLATAGRRALWRGDTGAASPLLEHALELTRPQRFDIHLELDLADAQPGPREQAAVAEAAAARARETGDRVGEALASVAAARARVEFGDDRAVDELEQLARTALPLLEQEQDHAGLGRVWYALSYGVANFRGQFEAGARAAEQALRHFRLAGQHPFGVAGLDLALGSAPQPADEALQALDSVLPANPHPRALLGKARLLAMLGRFDEARTLALPAAERLRELGSEPLGDWLLAEIAILAGDDATAVDYLRRACDMLEQRGYRAFLSTFAPKLGRSLCALGRYREAERLSEVGRKLGAAPDFLTQMLWRQVQARVSSHRGDHAEAKRLANEAISIGNETDALNWQGDALSDLAEVLAAAGRTDEAADALEQALERYQQKKNLAMVAQVKPKLEGFRAHVS
jgi:tetratricopeptide (TPR) repeat protein